MAGRGDTSERGFTKPSPSEATSAAKDDQLETSVEMTATQVHTAVPGMRRDRGTSQSRSSSLPSTLRITKSPPSPSSQPSSGRYTPTPVGKRSVKHLTCYWWREKGQCRHSAEDCLYAHHDTGHYTDPPRQLAPGQPAVAGRSLQRAIRNLSTDSRASSSLANIAGNLPASRPATPTSLVPVAIYNPLNSYNYINDHIQTLQADNALMRNLLIQQSEERGALVSALGIVQEENKELKSKLGQLKSDREQLIQERDALRTTTSQLQQSHLRPFKNPFGAIGTGMRSISHSELRNSVAEGNNRHSLGA